MRISYSPIGIIHSPFKSPDDMPIQPTSDSSENGHAELDLRYSEGLKDLEGFSHIILIYHLHLVSETELTVTPFLGATPRGVFATRAPTRPNNIGLSVVRLLSIEDNVLHLANLDVIDGTPLLDIKPFIPDFDAPPNPEIGWLQNRSAEVRSARSDKRFDQTPE